MDGGPRTGGSRPLTGPSILSTTHSKKSCGNRCRLTGCTGLLCGTQFKAHLPSRCRHTWLQNTPFGFQDQICMGRLFGDPNMHESTRTMASQVGTESGNHSIKVPPSRPSITTGTLCEIANKIISRNTFAARRRGGPAGLPSPAGGDAHSPTRRPARARRRTISTERLCSGSACPRCRPRIRRW